jgi:hypothetical protein
MSSPGPAHHALTCVECGTLSSPAEAGLRGHRSDALIDNVGNLVSGVWTFVRSDPASISRLNVPGQWSTWQAADPPVADRGSHARSVDPSRAERRSLRRRRSVTLF